MKFTQIVIPLFILFGLVEESKASLAKFNQQYEHFLKVYTKGNKVDYAKILINKKVMQKLVHMLEKISLKGLPPNELKAFWINAYNLSAMKTVVDNYRIYSPKQVSGFFTNVKHSLGGARLTLDNIEHKKILAVYADPRVHFALVCASRGCPKIINQPYHGPSIEQ